MKNARLFHDGWFDCVTLNTTWLRYIEHHFIALHWAPFDCVRFRIEAVYLVSFKAIPFGWKSNFDSLTFNQQYLPTKTFTLLIYFDGFLPIVNQLQNNSTETMTLFRNFPQNVIKSCKPCLQVQGNFICLNTNSRLLLV